MNPLVHFRWYRRWRGGVWGHHSALLHPWKTWTRFDYRPDDFSERLGDEDWRAASNDGLGHTPRTRRARMDDPNMHAYGEHYKLPQQLGMSTVDAIADDGCRNAAGGIYATRVQEFAREVQRAFAQENGLAVPGLTICRSDGRCQYAIDHGAEGMGHCPKGKCVMPDHGGPVA